MEQLIAVMADREQMYQVVFQALLIVEFMLAVAVAVEILVDHLYLQLQELVDLEVVELVVLFQREQVEQELKTQVVEVEVVLVEIIHLMVVQAEQVVKE
tara:strand:- start:1758 stop:2054 length:297 start_codon:yes stop_codon:yes gene_type:complete